VKNGLWTEHTANLEEVFSSKTSYRRLRN